MASDAAQDPITGKSLPFNVIGAEATDLWAVQLSDPSSGRKVLLSGGLETWFRENNYGYWSDRRTYGTEDVESGLRLWASLLWRNERFGPLPLLVCRAEEYAEWEEAIERGRFRFLLRSLDNLIEEAAALTFRDKCMRTLENLYTLWRGHKAEPLRTRYAVATDAGPTFRYAEGHEEDGVTYACTAEEAAFVYDLLYGEGYLYTPRHFSDKGSFLISGKGFAELDRIARGKSASIRRGFLVRRWDESLDEFLDPVMEAVGRELNCPIRPVWGKEHIGRIDEKIFREIREASVVIVDVSPDRYNVGLEHGYAMALGKPVVVIRERPDPWISPPFDISTQNCYDYTRDDNGAAALAAKLIARVGLALDLLAIES